VYPSYTISRPTAIFQTRQDLLEYEAACQLQLDAMNACEAGNWRVIYVDLLFVKFYRIGCFFGYVWLF